MYSVKSMDNYYSIVDDGIYGEADIISDIEAERIKKYLEIHNCNMSIRKVSYKEANRINAALISALLPNEATCQGVAEYYRVSKSIINRLIITCNIKPRKDNRLKLYKLTD